MQNYVTAVRKKRQSTIEMTYTFSCCDDGSGTTVGTIIRFDNVTILLDPSWHNPSVSYFDSINYWSTIIPEIDIILLSQPSLECLGAYSLLYYNFISHFMSRIEVFSTLPVSNLGRISTIELYVARGVIGPYQSNEMDIEDIEKSFDYIKTVKYSQLVDLKSKFDGLTLVAYNSGVHAGGSIWCISTYSEKLIYARHWNHTKDTILNGAALLDSTGKPLSTLLRSTAIITTFDKFGSTNSFRKRTTLFRDTLKEGLQLNGSVIVPIEIGGNFLDLLVQVHDFLYENSKYKSQSQPQVLLIAYSRGRALTYARSMLEWLSSSLIKTWELRDNVSPFDLGKKFHVVTPDEVSNYPGSKICFVSQVDLLVNEVIKKSSKLERTTVLITSSKYNDTELLSRMYKKWENERAIRKIEEGTSILYSELLTLKKSSAKSLTNKELEKFNKRITERREARLALENTLKKEAKKGSRANEMFLSEKSVLNQVLSDDEADEDEDEDEENMLERSASSAKKSINVPVDTIITKSSTPKHKMFQFQPTRVKADEYGSFVDFNMFIPEEITIENENSKRSASDVNGADEDPYDVTNPQNATKRSRRDDRNKEQNDNSISFDNIDYLDTSKNPSKRTISESEINIKCSLVFMNLESLVDQRSVSVIWPSFKPKKMILLGPEGIQNKNIITMFSKRDIEMIEMPMNTEKEFNTTIKSLDVLIDPELDQMLRWQRIGDGHTVAHVIGRLVKEKAQSTKKDDEDESYRTKLVLKPIDNGSKIHTGISLSIGDIRLAEVKRKLTDLRHIAEFKGEGTLVIDGQISVRKISDGETIVDGPPSELYDIVKKAVVDMLAKI